MKNHRVIIHILLMMFSLLIIIFSFHNDFMYSKTIVKITNVQSEKIEEATNSLGLTEEYFLQIITGVVTSGKEKGKEITLENEYTTSNVVTEKYQVGDKVFVKNHEVESLKRDSYMITIMVVFILGLAMIGNIRGFLTIISVIVNTIIFCLGAKLYLQGIHLLLLCVIESFVFAGLSLLLTSGFHKKTYIAILSVFISFIVLMLFSFLVIHFTDYQGISFNEISFLTVPVTDVFICELLIGGLGAIMDIAITITSSTNEIIEKSPKITRKNLILSLSNIGSDVMGTMINVLFFTYFCGSLPVFVLAIRNGYSVFNFLTTNFSIELSRFLVGSIGILLTIPISILVSTCVYKRGDLYE